MNGQETWASSFRGQFRGRQLARTDVQAGDVDPFALRAGVSAEVDEQFVVRGRGLFCRC